MKALVIAAGRGSGFNGQAPRSHKTLVPVWGLTVIERVLAAFPELEELVVVTGFQAGLLENRLSKILSGRVKLTFVRNPEWQRANGVSVLAAKEILKNERAFLLTMSDHVFERSLVEKLTAAPPASGECLLAVDRNLPEVYDLADATKVKRGADNRIRAIGKQLEDFDAVDTGVFYCTPALFEALELAIALGGESLSDGIRILCNAGKMRYREVSGSLWQDVDNLESLAEAKKRVWRATQKPRDGVVSRLLNRRISGFITRRICGLPVRPNQVTIFNLLLAGLAGWLMFAGHLVWGGLLAQLYSVLDGVDGELSRLKHQGSWFGSWLDNLTDRLCDWLIICGAAWSVTWTGVGTRTAWGLLLAALLSNIAYRSSMDSLLVSGSLRQAGGNQGRLASIEKWFYEREMVFGVTHDSYLLLLALVVAFGAPLAGLTALVALETLWWIAKTVQAGKTRPSDSYAEFLAAETGEKINEKKYRIAELAAR